MKRISVSVLFWFYFSCTDTYRNI